MAFADAIVWTWQKYTHISPNVVVHKVDDGDWYDNKFGKVSKINIQLLTLANDGNG